MPHDPIAEAMYSASAERVAIEPIGDNELTHMVVILIDFCYLL